MRNSQPPPTRQQTTHGTAPTPRDVWGRALDAVVLAFGEVFQQQAQMVELEAVRSE